MDEELELSDEVRELFLAGKLDALLEHVAQVGAEASTTQARLREREYRKATDSPERRQTASRWYQMKMSTDPDWAERRREYIRNYQRTRMANDPDYRDRQRAAQKRLRDSDEYRERQAALKREKYANDPEYRRKVLDAHSRRLREDEGFRERRKAYMKEYRARKKAEREAQENND